MGAIHQALLSVGATVGTGPQPSDLANLELWLKAEAITGLSDGDQIVTWPDSSGNGRNATGASGGSGGGSTTPLWKASGGANNLPYVYMNNAVSTAGAYFTLPNFLTGFSAGNIFVVFIKDQKFSVSPGFNGGPTGTFGSTTDDYFTFTDAKIYDGFGSTARKTTVDPGDITTNWLVYEVRSAAGAWSNHMQGVQLFTTATNTVGWTTTPTIGHTTTNNKVMRGKIGEIILFSRIVDDTTERRANLHQYFNNKFAFSLPT